jgi:hypothetical protein
MRFWKPLLALAVASAALTALFVRAGVLDTLVMVLIGGTLIGAYLLRHHARSNLVYNRHIERDRGLRGDESDQTENRARPAMGVARAGSGDAELNTAAATSEWRFRPAASPGRAHRLGAGDRRPQPEVMLTADLATAATSRVAVE